MITLDCMRSAEKDNMILGWAASVAAETDTSIAEVISALYDSMREISKENE